MKKEIISSNNAPSAIGPYSQAVQFGNLYFFSGQIALHPETGELEIDDLAEETHRVMKNIGGLLGEIDCTFDHIIKSSIFLSDMNNFYEVNEIYASYFTNEFPARETVEVSCLPKRVNVEISVIVGK